jgi:NADPH:quinone reductase-like Zn-dependent oxidoreductase
MAIRDVTDPVPTSHQTLVGVEAFSLNRGGLASIARNGVGWIPG